MRRKSIKNTIFPGSILKTASINSKIQRSNILVFNSQENNWIMKFNKLKKWLEKTNGLYPKMADDPKLYGFVAQIRNKSKNNLLTHSQMRLLKSISFVFNAREANWLTKFNKVKSFMDSHNGELPRMGNKRKIKEYDLKNDKWIDKDREDEYFLGKWIMSQRDRLKKGLLNNARKELLESIDIGINGYEKKWSYTFNKLYVYVVKNKSLPKIKDNVSLNGWYKRNLLLFEEKNLDMEKRRLFGELMQIIKASNKSAFSDYNPNIILTGKYKKYRSSILVG